MRTGRVGDKSGWAKLDALAPGFLDCVEATVKAVMAFRAYAMLAVGRVGERG
jgi:hypothetical protein